MNNTDINNIQSLLKSELKTMLSYNKDGRRNKERCYKRKQKLIHLANLSMALNVLLDKSDLFNKTMTEEANNIIRKEIKRLWHI